MALTTLANVKAWLPSRVDRPITAITRANPGVATSPSHGLQTGAQIIPHGIRGMTALNDTVLTLTVLDPNSFSIGVDTSEYPEYEGGGLFGADDVLLARLLNAASETFERETQRTFAAASHSWWTNGNGRHHLFLPNYPVSEVSSLAIDGTSIPESLSDASTGLCSDGWYLEDDCLSLLGYRFNRGRRNVLVVYAGGYETIPEDIQQAVISLTAYWYQGRQRIGERSKNFGESTVSFLTADMPDDVRAAIERYRRPPLC